jgi:transposase
LWGMDARELRKEVGKRPAEELLELVLDELAKTQARVRRLEAENERLRKRLKQYEPEVAAESSSTAAEEGNAKFSLEAEEKRRRTKRKRKRSPGRRSSRLKFEAAETIEEIRPPGVPLDKQRLVRERPVWRLHNGRAVLVGYRLFDVPGSKPPAIPGVTPRCEFGIEILVVLAFLVYLIGISLDKACVLLQFFCQLPIRKSQADALLRQLGRHWEGEFETLCTLLTRAAVVYMDETGWKIGQEKCSLWAFLSDSARVFVFGCRKDAATLEKMLPPELFDGVGVSDNAAVYTNQFAAGQKCWAHLLRKAIRLSLLYPRSRKYKRFLDQLLAIYRDGKRAAADGRLGEAGRSHRVAELEGRLCELCNPYWREPAADCPPHQRDFYNLVNELLTLVMAEELFTFVLRPEVDATNNFSERELRGPAQDRKAGRTNKTAAGAHRRSVIVSVLQSLKANLPHFTLESAVSEVTRWIESGVSLFAETLHSLPPPLPTADAR